MLGAHFSVQNDIGSRLELSAAWGINHADLLQKKGLLFTVQVHCQISVLFFQDGSL